MQSVSINYIIQNLRNNNDDIINDFKSYLANNEETIRKLFPLFIVMLMRAAERNISIEDINNNKTINNNVNINNDILNSERNLRDFREKRILEQINEKLNNIFKSTSNLVKSSETGLSLLNQLLNIVKERNGNRKNSLSLFDNFLSGRTGKILLSILGPLMAGASIALIASYLLSDINEETADENKEKNEESQENEEIDIIRNELNIHEFFDENTETTTRNIEAVKNIDEIIVNNREAIENIIENNENSNNAIARLMILGQSLGLSGNTLNEFVKESMNIYAEHYEVENPLINKQQKQEPQNGPQNEQDEQDQNEQLRSIIENEPLTPLSRTIDNNMYLQQNDVYSVTNIQQNKETDNNVERISQTNSNVNFNTLLTNIDSLDKNDNKELSNYSIIKNQENNINDMGIQKISTQNDYILPLNAINDSYNYSLDKENDDEKNNLFVKHLSNYTIKNQENNINDMGIQKISAQNSYDLPLNTINDSLKKNIKNEIKEQTEDEKNIVKLTKKGFYENENLTISARKINFKFDNIDFVDMLMRDNSSIDYDMLQNVYQNNSFIMPASFDRTIKQSELQRIRSYENSGDAGIEPNENDLERQHGIEEIHPSLQVPGLQSDIQKIGTEILEDFPQVVVTSTYRPYDIGSQHSLGKAIDLSLRQLSQDQRAQLVRNLTSEKYGRIGGIGTYNASGDLLHIDTRPSQKLAWGPNRSITSLNQTPLWFQQAVAQWMGNRNENNTLLTQTQQTTANENIQRTSAQTTIQQTNINTGTTLQRNIQTISSKIPAATQENIVAENTREPPNITNIGGSGSNNIIPGTSPPSYFNSPNDPGNVEPENASEIYALLFGI